MGTVVLPKDSGKEFAASDGIAVERGFEPERVPAVSHHRGHPDDRRLSADQRTQV